LKDSTPAQFVVRWVYPYLKKNGYCTTKTRPYTKKLLYTKDMEIVYAYQRKRREFGRSCSHFETSDSSVIIDTKSDQNQLARYTTRNPVEIGVQCVPSMSEHFVCPYTLQQSYNTNCTNNLFNTRRIPNSLNCRRWE
jgi:hypothetical protein